MDPSGFRFLKRALCSDLANSRSRASNNSRAEEDQFTHLLRIVRNVRNEASAGPPGSGTFISGGLPISPRDLAFCASDRKVHHTNTQRTNTRGRWRELPGRKGGQSLESHRRGGESSSQCHRRPNAKEDRIIPFRTREGSSRCEPLTTPPDVPGHLALGTGWGPPTTRRAYSAARAPHGSQGPRGSWLRPGHFLSQQPGHRQVIALPGAPARLCAAAPLPRPGRPGPPPPPGRCQAGQLRAQPGRPRRGGSPRRCPPPGGGRELGGGRPGPHLPGRQEGIRASATRCAHARAADGWQP